MSYTKITQADLTGKGVIGLPDTPNLSTTDIQEKFDEIALDVIVPKFNDLSDELDASDIDSAIKSADITDMRLNADMAIEVSDDHGSTWSGTSSSGHRIMDGGGYIYPQESKMQFSSNVNVQDDSVNGITKVLIQPGEKGDPGKAATITIGDVESGVSASVVNVGSQTDAIFDFTLPKGDPGDAATIAVGTVTSGATASVINSGTSDAAVFNFVLPKGDQGDPGTGLTLLGTYATYADLIAAHPTGQRGNAYFVGDDTLGYVYLWDPDTSAWVNIGELKGPKGNTGATPSLSIGTVQTGSSSAVTITGTTDYPVLNFTLEQGDKGDTGSAATIAVGNVVSGQTASVTNVGSSSAAVFDFVLPQGDKGDQGDPTTVNGKTGTQIALYGSDIDMNISDSTKLDANINARLKYADNDILGAKNIAPFAPEVLVNSGTITWAIDYDNNTITVNGTADNVASPSCRVFSNRYFVPVDGEYILSGNAIDGDISDFTTVLNIYDTTASQVVAQLYGTEEQSATLYTNHIYRVTCIVNKGKTVSNAVFKPMIRPASYADDTYVPYAPTNRECAKKTDLTNIQATGATNTTGSTITSGTYFYLNGVLVRAKADIANGATFTSGTNYEAATIGADLKSAKQITDKINRVNVASGTKVEFEVESVTDEYMDYSALLPVPSAANGYTLFKVRFHFLNKQILLLGFKNNAWENVGYVNLTTS